MATREDLMIPGLTPTKSMSTNPFDNESMGDAPLDDLPRSELTDSVADSSTQMTEEQQQPIKYSMRGGLMSGNVIDAEKEHRKKSASPKRKKKSRSYDDEEEVDTEDLESGAFPPDSDYASRGPKNIWDTPSLGDKTPPAEFTQQSTTLPPPANPFVRSDEGREVGPSTGKRRRLLRLLVGAGIAVLILAVVAVIFIIRSGQSDKTENQRQIKLEAIIEKASTPEALSTEGSPQSRARNWLLYDDTLYLDPRTNATEAQVIQRYSLATLYFSTGGDTTWASNNWLQGGECDGRYWDHIDCTEDKEVRALAFGKSDPSYFCFARSCLLSDTNRTPSLCLLYR